MKQFIKKSIITTVLAIMVIISSTYMIQGIRASNKAMMYSKMSDVHIMKITARSLDGESAYYAFNEGVSRGLYEAHDFKIAKSEPIDYDKYYNDDLPTKGTDITLD